ncbi:MAG: serine/threonine protein kinase, partial [Labilithrix sp.]|nr:serine/threonine protein kinase [Labilithrix sp.]
MSDPASTPPTRQSGRAGRLEAAPEAPRDPPPGLPRIGEIVAGRYRIERVVGAGGMAHVLAARHVELGHAVALKVLDPTFGTDAGARERFAREARAMAALSSRHAVRVHDVGALATGLPFMVMELLEGSDLGEVLDERGPLAFDEACAYVEQACDAVEEAHEAGLVHRDLKPRNLFLARVPDGPPIVRVLDFGIARAIGGPMGNLQTLTRVGDVVGTLSYMAPEQIKSSRSVDRRADVWALGACLYRFVSGKRPFVARSEPALIEAILGGVPTPITEHRPDVPTVLVSVILRCLRKAPEERFPTARSLKSALAEARAIMAVELLREATEPARAELTRPLPSARAVRAARASV